MQSVKSVVAKISEKFCRVKCSKIYSQKSSEVSKNLYNSFINRPDATVPCSAPVSSCL